jgi:hypothetical protein
MKSGMEGDALPLVSLKSDDAFGWGGRLNACFPLDRAVRKGGTMRSIAAGTVVAICGSLGSAAIAEQRQALCKFVVNGKTYINGRCDFEVIDPDGSFTITGKVHFAYVMVKGNTADATWNRDPKSFHADSPLGTLTRRGACWENATAQICARNLPTDN